MSILNNFLCIKLFKNQRSFMYLKETKLARICQQNFFRAQIVVMFFGGLHSCLHFRCDFIRATIER